MTSGGSCGERLGDRRRLLRRPALDPVGEQVAAARRSATGRGSRRAARRRRGQRWSRAAARTTRAPPRRPRASARARRRASAASIFAASVPAIRYAGASSGSREGRPRSAECIRRPGRSRALRAARCCRRSGSLSAPSTIAAAVSCSSRLPARPVSGEEERHQRGDPGEHAARPAEHEADRSSGPRSRRSTRSVGSCGVPRARRHTSACRRCRPSRSPSPRRRRRARGTRITASARQPPPALRSLTGRRRRRRRRRSGLGRAGWGLGYRWLPSSTALLVARLRDAWPRRPGRGTLHALGGRSAIDAPAVAADRDRDLAVDVGAQRPERRAAPASARVGGAGCP